MRNVYMKQGQLYEENVLEGSLKSLSNEGAIELGINPHRIDYQSLQHVIDGYFLVKNDIQ